MTIENYVGEKDSRFFIDVVMMFKVFKNNSVIFNSECKNKTLYMNSFKMAHISTKVFEMFNCGFTGIDNLMHFFVDSNCKAFIFFPEFAKFLFQFRRNIKWKDHSNPINLSNSLKLILECGSFSNFFNFLTYSSFNGSSSTGCQSILSQNSWSSLVNVPVLMNLSNISFFKASSLATSDQFTQGNISNLSLNFSSIGAIKLTIYNSSKFYEKVPEMFSFQSIPLACSFSNTSSLFLIPSFITSGQFISGCLSNFSLNSLETDTVNLFIVNTPHNCVDKHKCVDVYKSFDSESCFSCFDVNGSRISELFGFGNDGCFGLDFGLGGEYGVQNNSKGYCLRWVKVSELKEKMEIAVPEIKDKRICSNSNYLSLNISQELGFDADFESSLVHLLVISNKSRIGGFSTGYKDSIKTAAHCDRANINTIVKNLVFRDDLSCNACKRCSSLLSSITLASKPCSYTGCFNNSGIWNDQADIFTCPIHKRGSDFVEPNLLFEDIVLLLPSRLNEPFDYYSAIKNISHRLYSLSRISRINLVVSTSDLMFELNNSLSLSNESAFLCFFVRNSPIIECSSLSTFINLSTTDVSSMNITNKTNISEIYKFFGCDKIKENDENNNVNDLVWVSDFRSCFSCFDVNGSRISELSELVWVLGFVGCWDSDFRTLRIGLGVGFCWLLGLGFCWLLGLGFQNFAGSRISELVLGFCLDDVGCFGLDFGLGGEYAVV